uniref:Uncharacterized protein n=1 Tax=Pipistrellus kuhlii TaxID=59472 RepID=A0A7J7SFW6_PIPKU|nr:hypothetical protein mPipKuh1_009993 [Pipistrellus kuhlii]
MHTQINTQSHTCSHNTHIHVHTCTHTCNRYTAGIYVCVCVCVCTCMSTNTCTSDTWTLTPFSCQDGLYCPTVWHRHGHRQIARAPWVPVDSGPEWVTPTDPLLPPCGHFPESSTWKPGPTHRAPGKLLATRNLAHLEHWVSNGAWSRVMAHLSPLPQSSPSPPPPGLPRAVSSVWSTRHSLSPITP